MALPALKDEKSLSSTINDLTVFEMHIEAADLGKPRSLRHRVLHSVIQEKYDIALQDLRDFLGEPSVYPDFKRKSEKFINHSVDLVYAIKAKRSFPGLISLTRAKQQEFREKFKGHLGELVQALKSIERIENDLRIRDVRSTIYVVRALWYSAIGVVGFAFFQEMNFKFMLDLVQEWVILASDGAEGLTRMIGW